jgi:hypothetical protein
MKEKKEKKPKKRLKRNEILPEVDYLMALLKKNKNFLQKKEKN